MTKKKNNDEMANLVEIQKRFGVDSKEYIEALEALTGISDEDGVPSENLLETLRERNRE